MTLYRNKSKHETTLEYFGTQQICNVNFISSISNCDFFVVIIMVIIIVPHSRSGAGVSFEFVGVVNNRDF